MTTEGVTESAAEKSYRQGSARLRVHRWADAAGAFERAVADDDRHGQWFHRLGIAYQKFGRWHDAAGAFSHAVQRDNGASHGWYRLDWRHRLAFAYRMCGDQENASATYLSEPHLDPGLVEWWTRLAGERDDRAESEILNDLWSLIDDDGRLATEDDASAMIDRAQTKPHLYPDKWWFAAYTSLYRRGWIVAAYRAKVVAAFVSRYSAAPPTEQSTPQLAETMTAFADVGDYDTALTYIKEAIARTPDRAPELATFLESAAGLHALSGQMDRAQAIWRRNDSCNPHCRDEQSFHELVRGRRVAVVAPAGPIEAQGDEIDGYDLVVRTNFRSHALIAQHARAIGSRTDISYYNGNFEPENRDAILAELASNPVRFIVLRFDDPIIKTYQDLVPVRVSHLINPFYRMNSYAVPKIVYDLLRFQPGSIKVFNADFFLGPAAHYEGYLDYHVDLIPSYFGHDILRNFLLMQRWFEMGVVDVDDRLSQILRMTADQVITHVAKNTQRILSTRKAMRSTH